MDCTEAYREALMRDFAAKASPAPAPGQRRAAEAGRAGAERPLRRGPKSGRDAAETGGAAVAEA